MVMPNVRAAIELLYNDKCTISEYVAVKDSTTKITKHQESIVITDQPCKLSFVKISPAQQSASGASVSIVAKLFISPDITVKAGSKITVTRQGKTFEFQHSGEAPLYGSHQEVMLELFEGWA